MGLLSELKEELEETKFQPIEIEISDQQLIRIGIAVVSMGSILILLRALFNSLSKQ